jgi:hypothetical protein
MLSMVSLYPVINKDVSNLIGLHMEEELLELFITLIHPAQTQQCQVVNMGEACIEEECLITNLVITNQVNFKTTRIKVKEKVIRFMLEI